MPIVTTILKAMESRRFPVVCDQGGNQCSFTGGFIPPAYFKQRGVQIPLHSVPEKVRKLKQPLFRTDRGIDVDFRSVEITGQRIGNVACHDADSIDVLQMFLNACGIFVERNSYRIHGVQCLCAKSVLR